MDVLVVWLSVELLVVYTMARSRTNNLPDYFSKTNETYMKLMCNGPVKNVTIVTKIYAWTITPARSSISDTWYIHIMRINNQILPSVTYNYDSNERHLPYCNKKWLQSLPSWVTGMPTITGNGNIQTPAGTTIQHTSPVSSSVPAAAANQNPQVTWPGDVYSPCGSGNVKGHCRRVCFNNQSSSVLYNKLDLQFSLDKLRRKLKIDKSKLSATIRRVTSMYDDRKSSMHIGSVGVTVIACTIAVPILLDLTNLIKRRTKKNRSKQN